jgi:hypothetical protein
MRAGFRSVGWGVVVAAVVVAAAGCPRADRGTTPRGHNHPDAGPNGGTLVEWGGQYHAEFTVDHEKQTTVVYVLDSSAKKAPALDPAQITDVVVSITNVTPPVRITLQHDAGKSGPKGIAFVGTHEALKEVKEYKGNISGKVAGKEVSGDFEEKPHDH